VKLHAFMTSPDLVGAEFTARDGYGLGLSIVQRLVKLLTLKLDVHSEVGQGSAFSLVVPASSGKHMAANGSSRGSPAFVPRQIGEARVLLVEDNASVRRATSVLLELEGYRERCSPPN